MTEPGSPDEKPEAELRERPRVRIERLVRFVLQGAKCTGLAVDLSSKGALIRLPQRGLSDHASPSVELGEILDVSFEIGAGKDEVTLESEVCRLTDDGFAVQFTDPDSDTASTLGSGPL